MFLPDYSQDPSIFTRIVTSDETSIHYSTPSTKKQMMVQMQKQAEEPVPKKKKKKMRMKKSEKGMTVMVFWDHEGVSVSQEERRSNSD